MMVSIYDILIHSNDKGKHTADLRIVLQTLIEQQLYGKLKKSKFCLKVVFLGHVVSKERIKVNPREGESNYKVANGNQCDRD